MEWVNIRKEKCELEGPYECGGCGGHIMFDTTFLDQVGEEIRCPYCDSHGTIEVEAKKGAGHLTIKVP